MTVYRLISQHSIASPSRVAVASKATLQLNMPELVSRASLP
jgi:hypothetical protein